MPKLNSDQVQLLKIFAKRRALLAYPLINPDTRELWDLNLIDLERITKYFNGKRHSCAYVSITDKGLKLV